MSAPDKDENMDSEWRWESVTVTGDEPPCPPPTGPVNLDFMDNRFDEDVE